MIRPGVPCDPSLTCCDPSLMCCDPFAICQNTPGSFSCLCEEGYFGPGSTCISNFSFLFLF